MTVTLNVHEAKSRLSELLARVEQGEDIVIARAGRPVAHLTAVHPPPDRTFGIIPLTVPDSFFEHLPEAELAAWE
jgi:prevent-host-death family protein